MALTLASSSATQGSDFSTIVSGFTAGSTRSLADNETGVFHLADRDDTTMTLTASGADLLSLTAPGYASLSIDEKPLGPTSATTRTSFAITIARSAAASGPAVGALVVSPTYAVGDTVSIAAPSVSNMTAPYVYALADAQGLGRRQPPAGVTLNSTTGALSGSITSRQGAYNLVMQVTDANGRVAYSPPFSFNVYAPVLIGVPDTLLGADGQVLLGSDGQPLFGVPTS